MLHVYVCLRFDDCVFVLIFGLVTKQEFSPGLRPKSRLLESIVEEDIQFNPLSPGQTGEDSLTQIPFQVLFHFHVIGLLLFL